MKRAVQISRFIISKNKTLFEDASELQEEL